MHKVKHLLVLALVGSSPALAGEIGGNGGSTPIRSGVAASICAYSGLNDEFIESGMGSRVQSYGQIVAAFGGRPPIPGPGTSCRG